MTQLHAEDFKHLMRTIVVDEFPDELLAFDISADQLIQSLRNDGEIEKSIAQKGQINFVEHAMSVLGFIGVLITTYKAVIELKSLKIKNKLDEITIRKNWIEALRESGMSQEQINKLVSSHMEKFNEYLANEGNNH